MHIENEYHRDYNALEEHFRSSHFMCTRNKCIEQKFVVYSTKKELMEHINEVHGDSPSKVQTIISDQRPHPAKSEMHFRIKNALLFDHNEGSSHHSRNTRLLPSSFLPSQSLSSASLPLRSHHNNNLHSDNQSPLLSSKSPLNNSLGSNKKKAPDANEAQNAMAASSLPQNQSADVSKEVVKTTSNGLFNPSNASDNNQVLPLTSNVTSTDSKNLNDGELSQSSINEALNTLTIYQKELLTSLFDDDDAMVKEFINYFAMFHFKRIGAMSLAQHLKEMLILKYNGKELVNKIEYTTFFVNNFASLASSMYRYAGIDLGTLLVEGWKKQSSEILKNIASYETPPSGLSSSQAFSSFKKSDSKAGHSQHRPSDEMFPSLPASTGSPLTAATTSPNPTSKGITFSRVLKDSVPKSNSNRSEATLTSRPTEDFPKLGPSSPATSSYKPPPPKMYAAASTKKQHASASNSKPEFPPLPQSANRGTLSSPNLSASWPKPPYSSNKANNALNQHVESVNFTTKNKKGAKKIILF